MPEWTTQKTRTTTVRVDVRGETWYADAGRLSRQATLEDFISSRPGLDDRQRAELLDECSIIGTPAAEA